MKKRFKTVLSIFFILIDSFATPFIFSLLYIAFAGAEWALKNDCFDRINVFYCIKMTVVFILYLVSFILSNVYLGKKLYSVKKQLVIIPIATSIVLFIISFFTVFWNFQWM